MCIKACGITGHRKIENKCWGKIVTRLNSEIENAVNSGFTHFISGFAEGVDQVFAQIVIDKMKSNPAITLEAAIPYKNRYLKLMSEYHTKKMLEKCANIKIASETYHPGVFSMRNRYIVEHSSRVIAVYDGRSAGGTLSTIKMAKKHSKDLKIIPVYDSL